METGTNNPKGMADMSKWQQAAAATKTPGDAATQYLVAAMGTFPVEAKEWIRDWVNERQSFGLDIFKAVVDQVQAGYESQDGGRKPSVRHISKKYEARMANHDETQARQGPHCDRCQNSGWRHVVLGGDGPGNAKVIGKIGPAGNRVVEPFSYAVTNLLPCLCNCGQRSKLFGKFSPEYLQAASDYAFDGGIESQRFAEQCRMAWEADTGYLRKYAQSAAPLPTSATGIQNVASAQPRREAVEASNHDPV